MIFDFRTKARAWKQDVRRISDFTVEITNIPRIHGIDSHDLRHFFEQYGEVCNVVLCRANGRQLKKHEELGQLAVELQLQSRVVRQWMRRCESDPSQSASLEKELKALEERQVRPSTQHDRSATVHSVLDLCSVRLCLTLLPPVLSAWLSVRSFGVLGRFSQTRLPIRRLRLMPASSSALASLLSHSRSNLSRRSY